MDTRTALTLRDVEILFTPFLHRKINLPTRVVMAPMTRRFAADGIPPPDMAEYYRRRAENDLGLIITEGTVIDDPAAAADSDTPRFFGGAAMRGWKAICRAVHATNCKIIPQLWHVGMARPTDGSAPNPQEPPIGPSGIDPITLQQTAAPMSRSRIAEVIASFARAAANARRLGFDGVEIQGAHGFLIDQFLWAATNHRSDEYGGDLTRRVRFAREVVQAVRKAVGRHFPILLRLSQWKPEHYQARIAENADELAEIVLPLSEAGVDIFDISTRTYDTPEFEGSPLTLAGWVRQLTGKPVIAVGSVGVDSRPLTRLLQMLGTQQLDLIAIGRALLADHAWARKTRMGAEQTITPFTSQSLGRLI